MYSPKSFSITDHEMIRDFLNEHPFAMLVSNGEATPSISHLPLIHDWDGSSLKFSGHFAKANSHWKSIDQHNLTVIISGPHSYISPSWYADSREVPTWNYTSIHCQGVAKIIHDQDWNLKTLKQMVQRFEKKYTSGQWAMIGDEPYVEGSLGGIVGIEIAVTSLQAKFKLGQNRSDEDQQSLMSALACLKNDNAQGLLTQMKKLRSKA